MLRFRGATFLAAAILVSACAGQSSIAPPPSGTEATPEPTSAPSTPSSPPASVASGSSSPSPAASAVVVDTTVELRLIDGPDKGLHEGKADPHCSFGFLAGDVWAVNYEDPAVTGKKGLSGLTVTTDPVIGFDPFGFNATFFIGANLVGTKYVIRATAADDIQNSVAEWPVGSGVMRLNLEGIESTGSYVRITVYCPTVA
jgi:hypothetical protein